MNVSSRTRGTIRICYDYQIFVWQRYGGISRYFVELASRIQAYPGAQVHVVAPFYRNNLLAARRDIHVLGMHQPKDFPRSVGMFRRFDSACSPALLSVYRPHIVHETYHWNHKSSNRRAKAVVTVYDLIEEIFPDLFPGHKNTIEIRRSVFARANHLICISESTRTDLIRLYDVDPQKVSVVHLASSLSKSAQPPITLGDPFFLYVGERGGYKNFGGLITAFAASCAYKTHKLVCFGGGAFSAHEQAAIQQLGIPFDRIVMASGGDELLSRYYAGAEAFIYPSLYEGFGLPLLEAMECGCPVLCGNAGSMPEIAGDAAMYFDPGDTEAIAGSLLKISESPAERAALVSKGQSRIRSFSWDKCARQTYAIYERLLSNQ